MLIPPLLRTLGTAGVAGEDATHPKREWRYRVSANLRSKTTGEQLESMSVDVTYSMPASDGDAGSALSDRYVVSYPDFPITLRRGTKASPFPTPTGWDRLASYEVTSYNVYKGRGESFGLVGNTTTREFIDPGIEPDYNIQPKRGTNPFSVKDQTDTNLTVDWDFPAYDLFLPKYSKEGVPVEDDNASPSKLIKFKPEEHIKKKKAEPVNEFGGDSTTPGISTDASDFDL